MATESGLGYTLVPPRSYTSGRKSGQPTVIVLHTTEGHEKATSAEDGAAYDQRREDGTSTHFFVDSNSIVQCVRTTDEAHTARSHGNDVGIQIEICGKAGQGSSGWADEASRATLENVARLCVQLRKKYPGRFPLRRLSPQQLRSGETGFAGHVDCTNAWPEDKGTHTDPGPTFPWASVLARIADLEDDDMNRDETLALLRSTEGKDAIGDAVLERTIDAPDDVTDVDGKWYITTWLTSARNNARDAVITARAAKEAATQASQAATAGRADLAALTQRVAATENMLAQVDGKLDQIMDLLRPTGA